MIYPNAKAALLAIEARRRIKKDLPAFQAFVREVCPAAFSLPIIHVAGTNGKGSTVNFIRAQLQALGYRVGTLTSPALYVHYDRIRINDQWMDEDTFLALVNRYDERWQALGLAMFDIDVHLAMEWFVQQRVDAVILETGLGGRLDATNIFLPNVCVITNIGHDHMQYLGDTLEKISREKGGIIKEQIPLVTSEKNPSCLSVLRAICKEKKAPFYQVQAKRAGYDEDGSVCFDYEEEKDLHLSTMALYQADNAVAALKSVSLFCPTASMDIQRSAIAACQWAGRFQILQEHPTVIVDGAHNREGIQALCTTLKQMPVDTILFSVLKDKEAPLMIEQLQQVCQRLILCPFQQERLADLADLAKTYHLPMAEDLETILQERMRQDERILICGSLYFVSEAIRLFPFRS